MGAVSEGALGVGLVGAGFLAATRARCWRRVHRVDARVVVVCAGRRESADRFATEHGVAAATADLEEVLARDDVQLVDLCVPNHLHRPFAEAAAAAGKHVLCTKPMAAYVGQDLESPREGAAADGSDDPVATRDRRAMLEVAVSDAEAMVAAARAAGVSLLYGENWVYAPSIRRAAALLERAPGVLLEMRGWESHSGSHSPYSKQWRHTGGGALLRLGAHPIGAMLHLKRREGLRLRGEPVRVVAVTGEVADPTRHAALTEGNTRVATGWRGVESWGTATLAFDDGTRGVVYGSDLMLGGMESRLDLMASDSHLKCRLSPHDLLSAYATDEGTFGDAYVMEKVHGQAGWSTPLPDEDWASGQQGMLQAFAEDVVSGRAPESDGTLGLDVTRAVYAAYVSAAEGRRVELA